MSVVNGVLEVIAGWASGRFKKAIPYLGTLLTFEEARQTINASRSLDANDSNVKKISGYLGLDKNSKACFYSSEHFTHIQQQTVEDQISKSGGVAHLLDLEAGSIWLWHPNPRYMPMASYGYSVLLTRVKEGSGFSTTFHEAFGLRLQRYQEFQAFIKRNATP